jgi:hypothetical protein
MVKSKAGAKIRKSVIRIKARHGRQCGIFFRSRNAGKVFAYSDITIFFRSAAVSDFI